MSGLKFKHKKSMDKQIVLPETFYKRTFASLKGDCLQCPALIFIQSEDKEQHNVDEIYRKTKGPLPYYVPIEK